MNILAARKYHTPRNGPLTLEQTETRRLAYAIKSTASPSAARKAGAQETVTSQKLARPAPETQTAGLGLHV